MTSVFHQEMVNFYVKPQYRYQMDMWEEEMIDPPDQILIDFDVTRSCFKIEKEKEVLYDEICIFFGSQTGNSARFAVRLANTLSDYCDAPLPLDNLPNFLKRPQEKRTLIIACSVDVSQVINVV